MEIARERGEKFVEIPRDKAFVERPNKETQMDEKEQAKEVVRFIVGILVVGFLIWVALSLTGFVEMPVED